MWNTTCVILQFSQNALVPQPTLSSILQNQLGVALDALTIMLLENGEPSSYREAMVGPDSDKWLEAIKSERGSMYENKV